MRDNNTHAVRVSLHIIVIHSSNDTPSQPIHARLKTQHHRDTQQQRCTIPANTHGYIPKHNIIAIHTLHNNSNNAHVRMHSIQSRDTAATTRNGNQKLPWGGLEAPARDPRATTSALPKGCTYQIYQKDQIDQICQIRVRRMFPERSTPDLVSSPFLLLPGGVRAIGMIYEHIRTCSLVSIYTCMRVLHKEPHTRAGEELQQIYLDRDLYLARDTRLSKQKCLL